MTGSADEPLRLGATGGRHGAARAPRSALLSAPRAIRDAIYARLEETRFRTGVIILAGCLVTGAALGIGAVLLSSPAPAARTPQAARPAAVPPASPLASSYRPHTARPRTPVPASQPQQLAPAASGQVASAPSAPAPASAPAATAPRSRCWPFAGWDRQDGGQARWPCAGAWRSWRHFRSGHWKR